MHEQIKNFIIRTFMGGKGTLDNGEPLFVAGIIDSLGFLELLAFLEKTFHVSFRMSEITMDNFASVDKIAGLVQQKQNDARL